ncbi:MAG TPA: trypsin-like serine protease [Coleofasciculaceae cyanobacterium]
MLTLTFTTVQSVTIISTVGLLASFFASPQAKATTLIDNGSTQAEVQLFYTTTGNPSDYVVSPGTSYQGVTSLLLNFGGGTGGLCTGTLLGTGTHILTAAHCLTDDWGKLNVLDGTANFGLSTGNLRRPIANFFVNESWTGNVYQGYDVAIVELRDFAPIEVERYDIYRGTNEVGRIGTKVGYGMSGNGNFGGTLSAGTKRTGQNRYDASGSVFDQLFGSGRVTDAILASDFDNGLAANDAFGYWFGSNYADLGLGLNEVSAAPGDSGGPTFIDGTIAGITSFGLRLSWLNFTSDIDSRLDFSFGEFSFDTRVSSYASWIDNILNSWEDAHNSGSDNSGNSNPGTDNSGTSNPDSGNESESLPEPNTLAGLIALGVGFLLTRNKHRRQSTY